MSKNKNSRILGYWFAALIDEEFDAGATEYASEDDANVLPEPITLSFDPCSINYSEAELQEACNKSFASYCYANSQIIFNRLTNVNLIQALSKNKKLHRLGEITASNFHEACHLKSFAEKSWDIKNYFLELPVGSNSRWPFSYKMFAYIQRWL